MSFNEIINSHRLHSRSKADTGGRFERLMQGYLQTDPLYAHAFRDVWQWGDFPYRQSLGSRDTGIDLVAHTRTGDFWAVQCKCFQADARVPINPVCVCSDVHVGKLQRKNDLGFFSSVDLAFPASTEVDHIVHQLYRVKDEKGMTVVFSTYQSIDAVSAAIRKYGENDPDLGYFDLIVCDEAHRTTGVTLPGQDESAFVKMHDNELLLV